MKIKSLLHLVVVLLAGQFLFSCSSAEYYKFSAQKPEAYNKIKEKPIPVAEPVEVEPTMAETELAAANEKAKSSETAPDMEASAAVTAPALKKNKTAEVVKTPVVDESVTLDKREVTVTEAEALAMARERIANMTKAEKKELKKEVREAYRQGGGGANIIEIILAILLPPLAVFLHDGIGTSFWISIILTLLFFLPGIIYALLVVTDTI
ncbi:YqaE/Pmp3 family membrane protein [Pontibacter pamirensis]|uniref:YqaE/Pmp3 family membrane protein n=1 Tax=Pontibacter pamirensis TaxID=2562824 RepID=UPI0021CFA1B6|nr:YqaE/Pmp3 family membrane protein [Pontibacter pamirensis]